MTYGELDRRANQLAHHLNAIGIAPGAIVGVCVDRSFDMVIALLSILKAGAAYLPLDVNYPAQRLEYMIEDSRVKIIITRSPLIARLSFAGRLLDLQAEAARIAEHPGHKPEPRGTAHDLAYVIYTSGSTGHPKGVLVTHSLGGLLAWAEQTLSPDDLACVAATTSICFDPSVFEIFATLSLGGAIAIKSHLLEPFTDDERPTMLVGAPSLLAQLVAAQQIPATVRVILVGGEIVRARLIRDLYQTCAVRRVFNQYGPTEATVCATTSLASPEAADDPPIGHPIPGARVYLLDEHLGPVPFGAVGEIYIAGPLLARGYLNRPDLTRERFVSDPFAELDEQMYRTGDLGRWSASGDLVYTGRTDHQVKINGVRIELGEIEAALLRLPGVRQAAVVAKPSAGDTRRLVAVVGGSAQLSPAHIEKSLREWLPRSMIPSAFVLVERLPLTASGKIDRSALPEPIDVGGAAPVRAGRHGLEARERWPGPSRGAPLLDLVLKAWQQALSLDRCNPDVTWSEAGGDSLTAFHLLLRLERAVKDKLSFDLISADVTPRQLAYRLAARAVRRSPTSAPTVILIPGLFGDEPILADFRRCFGSALNFEMIELPDLDAKDAVLRSVSETGRLVAQEIARRRAEGALIVAGYSFGGIIAFEAMKHLQATGHTVDLLVLLDPLLPSDLGSGPPEWRTFEGADRYDTLAARAFMAWGRRFWRRRLLLHALGLFDHVLMNRVRRCILWRCRQEAVRVWRPVSSRVPALLVFSDWASSKVRSRWARLSGEATKVVAVPGAHDELFKPVSLVALRPALLNAIASTTVDRP